MNHGQGPVLLILCSKTIFNNLYALKQENIALSPNLQNFQSIFIPLAFIEYSYGPASQMGSGCNNSPCPQGVHSLIVNRQEQEDLRKICPSHGG